MARVKDLTESSLFSPEEKDINRQLSSAGAALLALPTLLGVVSGQTSWISSGSWQSFKEHFGKKLQGFFSALDQASPWEHMGGGASVFSHTTEVKKQLLKDLDSKGRNTFKKVELPSFIGDAYERAANRTLIRDVLTEQDSIWTSSRRTRALTYLKDFQSYVAQSSSQMYLFEKGSTTSFILGDTAEAWTDTRLYQIREEISYTRNVRWRELEKKHFEANFTKYQIAWDEGKKLYRTGTEWDLPSATALIPEDAKEASRAWERRQSEIVAKWDAELGGGILDDADLRAARDTLKRDLKKEGSGLADDVVKQVEGIITDLENDIGSYQYYENNLNLSTDEKLRTTQAQRAYVNRIRKTEVKSVIDKQVERELQALIKDKNLVNRFKTLRKAISIVNSTHGTMLDNAPGLRPMSTLSTDMDVIRFLEEEASPRYMRQLNKVVTQIIKKTGDFIDQTPEKITVADHIRTGDQIYKDLTDHDIRMSGKAGGQSEVNLYKNIRGKQTNVGSILPSGVETVRTALSEEQLTKVIHNRLNDYTVGLSRGERMRIGNVSLFNKKMDGLKKKHEAIFKMMGQGALHDQVNNYGAYAEQLSKGIKGFEHELTKIRAEVSRLSSMSVGGTSSAEAAEAALRLMAKGSGMDVPAYVKAIQNMSVNLEIKSTLRGEIAFPTADVILNFGNDRIKQSFSIERFGMFLPNKYNRVQSSAILLPVGGRSAKDAVNVTLAMIHNGLSRSTQIVSDIIESGGDSNIVERKLNFRKQSYLDLVGPRTGHEQDVIRGTKVISDEVAILSGTKPAHFYENYAAGKTSWFTGTDLYKTDTQTVTFDFEFNAPASGSKGSQMLIKDSRARIYWMNYITKKGGSNERIFNHFIRPENWEDIRESVQKFMVTKQPGDGFEMYQALNETFHEAGLKMEKNGKRQEFVDVTLRNESLKKRVEMLTGKYSSTLRVFSDEGGVLRMARDIYTTAEGKLNPGAPLWIGHNIRTADLPMLNKAAERALQSIQQKRFNATDADIRLLEKLALDTNKNTLLARGHYIDTYSMAALIHSDSYSKTSLSLTSMFDQIMGEAIDDGATRRSGRSLKSKFNSESWTANLASSVKESGGKITREIEQLLIDLPETMQRSLKSWIKENPGNVSLVFGQGMAHHSGHFDTRAVLLLKDLLFWKMETIKHRNPILYDSIMAIGSTSEGIVSGKMKPWNRTIDIFDKSSLGNFPERLDASTERVFSHLFALTPDLAAKGIGAIMGPENYIPFGQYTNLLKQMYQVKSASALAPGLAQREQKVFAGMAPAMQRSLEDVHASSSWTTSAGAAISHAFSEVERALGAIKDPVRSRFHVMTAYLPSNNTLVGQDTGLFTSEAARELTRHFPMGAEGSHIAVAHDAANRLAKKDMTIVSWLKQARLSPEVIQMVEENYGKMTLDELMLEQSRSRITLNLRMADKDRMEVLTGTKKTNVLAPGETFFRAKAVASEIVTEAGDRMVHNSKYNINNPLKYASILEQITYDFDKSIFVFDSTPVEAGEIIKVVDPTKLFKGNVVGVSAGIGVGKGIGLILGAKKMNMANFIDIHMKRALAGIHGKDLPIPDQYKLVKKMLMATWNLTEAQYEATFKLKIMPIAADKKFKNGLVVPELRSNYNIDLNSKTIMKQVKTMLKHSGITYANMKEIFVKQNLDILERYNSSANIREQLSKIYDTAIKNQRRAIDELALNIDVSTTRGHLIVEMQKLLKETDIALNDPLLITEDYLIDINKVQTTGLLDEHDQLIKGVKVEAGAHQVRQEMAVSETLRDFGKFNKRPVDAYGMPTKKTYSIWQNLVIYNASRNNEYFKDNFMRHVMSDTGIMDKNIKKAIHRHLTAMSSLNDGYIFNSEVTQTLTLKEMESDIAWLTELGERKKGKGIDTSAQRVSALMAQEPKLSQEEAQNMIAIVMHDEAESKFQLRGVMGQVYNDNDIFKMKLFSSLERRDGQINFKKDFVSYEIPSLKSVYKKVDVGLKNLIDDSAKLDRAKLMSNIRGALKERALNLGGKEVQLLEEVFNRFPGSFTEPLEKLLMPVGGPLGLEAGLILEGSSRAKVETIQLLTDFAKATKALSQQEGITEDHVRRLLSQKDEMFAQLAPRILTAVYKDLPALQWKAMQSYGRGQTFAKAMDATVFVKQGLGGILRQAELAAIEGKDFLSQRVFTQKDPVIAALKKLKSNIPNADAAAKFQASARATSLAKEFGYNTAEEFLNSKHPQGQALKRALTNLPGRGTVLQEMIEATRKITLGEILEGLTHDPNRKSDKSLMKIVDSQGFFIAKGTGVGETILPSSAFAASITSGDPHVMLAELTEGNAVSAWKRMLTGRQRVIDTVVGNPNFENTFGGLFSNAYIYQDRIFEGMHIKEDLSRILLINGIDAALQRRDFDGDLISRMLLSSRVDVSPGAYIDPYDIARKKGLTVEKGVSDQLARIEQKLYDRAMVGGKEAVQYGGQNLLELREMAGSDFGHKGFARLLVKDAAMDSWTSILKGTLGGVATSLADSEASTQLNKQGLMYMVQKLLTGRIGQQEKMYDMLYLGPNPGAHDDVVRNLYQRLIEPSKLGIEKGNPQIAKALGELGIETVGDPNRAARRYMAKVTTAWDILNTNVDYKTFNFREIDPNDTTGKKARVGWVSKPGFSKLNMIHEWVRAVTHELPIEKEKKGTVPQLIKATQDFNQFMRGGSDSKANRQLAKRVWSSFAVEKARASKVYIDVGSNIFETETEQAQAKAMFKRIKAEFLESFDANMQINDSVTKMTAGGMMFGQDAMYLASNKPKDMVYAALSDAFGIGAAKERQWMGSEISNFFASTAFNSVASAEAARDVLMTQMGPDLTGGGLNSLTRRAANETTGKFVSGLTKGLAHQRWTKRAAIGMMALAVLDPNTNSILLPGQRGRGEEYDIPSLEELTSSYNRKTVKFREYSPPLLDKMARSMGLPFTVGSSGRINRYLPPEPRRVHLTGVNHTKRNQASMQQFARRVDGILL